jgi:hypothetical protein
MARVSALSLYSNIGQNDARPKTSVSAEAEKLVATTTVAPDLSKTSRSYLGISAMACVRVNPNEIQSHRLF